MQQGVVGAYQWRRGGLVGPLVAHRGDPERIRSSPSRRWVSWRLAILPTASAKEVTARGCAADGRSSAQESLVSLSWSVHADLPLDRSSKVEEGSSKKAKTSGGAGVLGATGRPFQHLDRGSTEPRLAMGATRPAEEDWIPSPSSAPERIHRFLHWGSRGATPSGASGTDRHTGPCDLHVLQHRRHHLRALVRLARGGPEGRGRDPPPTLRGDGPSPSS